MITATEAAAELINAFDLADDLREGALPGLAAALASLDREPGLGPEGRERTLAAFRHNLQRLSDVAETRARHPEIADVEMDRPVFILGLPRCGTSLLHALVGADASVRTPMSWEVAAPSPAPEAATFDTDPRIAAFDAYVEANFKGKWADVLKAHPIGARVAQECGMILETSFQSLNLPMSFRVKDYYRWYRDADSSFAYRVHKMWLQHLGWRTPRPRWVLKVQEHMYHLPELFAAYPDALLVQPHRDPTTVMASISRLVEVIRSVTFDEQDPADLGEELLHLWHDGQVKMLAYRRAHPELRVYDMRYKDIARDPVAAVRGIYDFADIPFTGDAEASMRRWLAANPADKHGRHAYKLEDYGLTEARVREVYADYIDAYAEFI